MENVYRATQEIDMASSDGPLSCELNGQTNTMESDSLDISFVGKDP